MKRQSISSNPLEDKWWLKYHEEKTAILRGLPPRLQEYLEEMRIEATQSYEVYISEWIERCESPAEQLFALCVARKYYPELPDRFGWQAQHEIGPYRLDFLFTYPPPAPLDDWSKAYAYVGVEIDGHEFHDADTRRARRDKRRDRYLVKYNVFALRFAASEVWRDPDDVYEEVVKFAMDRHKELVDSQKANL